MLVAAVQDAAEDGQVSGAALARQLAARGLDVGERDARRVLALLRPGGRNNGDRPGELADEPAA